MRKATIGLTGIAVFMTLTLMSCTQTTVDEDIMMLQKKYPKAVVHRLDAFSYVIADSISVLNVKVNSKGAIVSTVKIR